MAGRTLSAPIETRETVCAETPARRATSLNEDAPFVLLRWLAMTGGYQGSVGVSPSLSLATLA